MITVEGKDAERFWRNHKKPMTKKEEQQILKCVEIYKKYSKKSEAVSNDKK